MTITRDEIRERLKQLNISQKKFCEEYEINRGNFSSWLRGKISSPASEKAVRLWLQTSPGQTELPKITPVKSPMVRTRRSTPKERSFSGVLDEETVSKAKLLVDIRTSYGRSSVIKSPDAEGRVSIDVSKDLVRAIEETAREYEKKKAIPPLSFVPSTRASTRKTILDDSINHLTILSHAVGEAGDYRAKVEDSGQDKVFRVSIPCHTSLGAPFAKEWGCRLFYLALKKLFTLPEDECVRNYLKIVWILDDDGKEIVGEDRKGQKSLSQTAIFIREKMETEGIHLMGTSPERNRRYSKLHRESKLPEICKAEKLEQFLVVQGDLFAFARFLPLYLATLPPTVWNEIKRRTREMGEEFRRFFSSGEDFGFTKDVYSQDKIVRVLRYRYFKQRNKAKDSTVKVTGPQKALSTEERLKKALVLLSPLNLDGKM